MADKFHSPDIRAKLQDVYHYLLCASGNYMTEEESTFCSERDVSLIGRLERFERAIHEGRRIAEMAESVRWIATNGGTTESPIAADLSEISVFMRALFAGMDVERVRSERMLVHGAHYARIALKKWCLDVHDWDAFRAREVRS